MKTIISLLKGLAKKHRSLLAARNPRTAIREWRSTNNERGSTLIGALMAMMLLAFGGAAVVQLSANENIASANDIQTSQAFWVTQAGLEDAVKTLRAGLSPAGTQSFGCGDFAISTQPQLSQVSVIGTCGNAEKDAAILAQFSKDCVTWDTAEALASDNQLCNVRLIKSCNDTAIMTSMVVNWNWDPCVYSQTDTVDELQESCPVDDGDAKIDMVNFAGAAIYDPANSLGGPSDGADSGDTIESADAFMTTDATYEFENGTTCIQFNTPIPTANARGGLYTITANFADGSSIQDSFLAQSTEDQRADFQVEPDGDLNIGTSQQVSVEVLGSAITYGATGPEVPVYVELGSRASDSNSAFSYTSLFSGADIDGGETYSQILTTDQDFCLKIRAEYRNSRNRILFRSTYDCHNQQQVLLLLNGDQAPPLAGFGGQRPVMDFLASYLDSSGQVVLNDNQVIALVESGVDMNRNPSSPAADFQDAVLLITVNPINSGGDTASHRCNQGIGNGAEGCDPGNSTNDQHSSNDEP